MTDVVNFKFKVVCHCDGDDVDELGKDLAIFLQESFFNGEDVFEVQYCGSEVIH